MRFDCIPDHSLSNYVTSFYVIRLLQQDCIINFKKFLSSTGPYNDLVHDSEKVYVGLIFLICSETLSFVTNILNITSVYCESPHVKWLQVTQ